MKLTLVFGAVLTCAAAVAKECQVGAISDLTHPEAAIWKLYRAPEGCLTARKPEYFCKLTNAANRDHVLSVLKDYSNYQWQQDGDDIILINCVDCPITQLANTVKTKISTAFDCQLVHVGSKCSV